MMCTLTNRPLPLHGWGCDPPHPALICTDSHGAVEKQPARGSQSWAFVAKLLSWRSGCFFHQFTESLHLALMFVLLHADLQRTRRPPLETTPRRILSLFADSFAYFPQQDNMSEGEQTGYFGGASVTGFAHKTLKEGGENALISHLGR